jgi:Fe-S cluster assembly protein SufD
VTSAFLQSLVTPAHQNTDEPAWLTALRAGAAATFNELGLPTTRNEDWKFTSVAPIAQGKFAVASNAPATPGISAGLRGFEFGEEWSELVFVNGRFIPDLSSHVDQAGLSVVSLAEALADQPQHLIQHLGQIARYDIHAFTALNTALLTFGAIVRVAPAATIRHPVHLVFIADGSDGPVASHPRVLIHAGESSDVTVIESFGSLSDTTSFTNAVTEVVVEANARVEHIKIQRESERAYHVGTVEARQAANSRFRSFSFALGGAIARTNIYSTMNEPGSDCTVNGLYLLHGSQHIDHQTRIEHAAPNCTSREVYKGVLDGMSHGVFNGKVFVRPEAQKTDGKQTNKNLLLSDGAKVDTKPQLEIFADDVKCTHGATVGRLDEIGLFYLESRGISAAVARRLLTYGFAADVLAEVTQDAVRHQLERSVFDRLETSVR